jgi:uncharacterized membrane protein YphA (DoxX/SURF4 family)
MNIALIVVATLLGLVATVSALGKLRRMPQVVETMHAVGVKDSQMPVLAILEILGALGLLIGIWIPLLGVLAAAGLTLYFLGAVAAHLRVKQPIKDFAPALALGLVALATTILELGR